MSTFLDDFTVGYVLDPEAPAPVESPTSATYDIPWIELMHVALVPDGSLELGGFKRPAGPAPRHGEGDPTP